MRFEHLQYQISRRRLLGTAAKAGAAGAVLSATGAGLLSGVAGAEDRKPGSTSGSGGVDGSGYDDSFSVEGALDGTWAAETAERYGAEDQVGTLNEITAEKTAGALGLLAGAGEVSTYGMGQLLRNGFPAFVNYPPRIYEQRLFVYGLQPDAADEFFTADTDGDAGVDQWRQADRERGPLGYIAAPEPLGTNQVTYFEERFPHGGTYQIATQLDGLNHIGVGDVYYNGFRAGSFARATGTSELGMEHVSPFVTRGVLLDVLGWKQSEGGGADIQTVNGHDMLGDTYRITVEDLQATMEWEGVDGIEAGDAVVIRTGWWWLAEDPATYEHYLATEPGIYIREAKWLGDHHPAVLASDTYGLEVLGADFIDLAFPVHQELLTHKGVHIGEGVLSDPLAERGAYTFVYSYSPQYALGSTAGNAPPVALVAG
ncbi:MAG: cyclase family protein [Acidimicrobiia bacterium]|nr:cyclase family protein [Acidimicrobiia bacterium]